MRETKTKHNAMAKRIGCPVGTFSHYCTDRVMPLNYFFKLLQQLDPSRHPKLLRAWRKDLQLHSLKDLERLHLDTTDAEIQAVIDFLTSTSTPAHYKKHFVTMHQIMQAALARRHQKTLHVTNL